MDRRRNSKVNHERFQRDSARAGKVDKGGDTIGLKALDDISELPQFRQFILVQLL